MGLFVQKYGGSSLATPKHIRRVALRIKALHDAGTQVVVVVSAMGRMTDHLITLAKKTVQRPPQRELDMLMTAGERISMALLAMALDEEGVAAISFTGSQSGIVTTSDHTEARIIDIKAFRIQESLAKGKVVIIAGFQGVSEQKEITTLGRGGSDTTAVALAATLGAEACEILTDVNGLYTADPRLVPNARLIASCSYDEALEMASLGAKMHSRSIEVARRYGVKVRVASSHSPEIMGTVIAPVETAVGEKMERTVIRSIATRDEFAYFSTNTSLPKILKLTRERKIAMRFFSGIQNSVSFICPRDKASDIEQALKSTNVAFQISPEVAVVSVVGDGLSDSVELVASIYETIEGVGSQCLLLSVGSSSISAGIASADKAKVTRALHEKFLETEGTEK